MLRGRIHRLIRTVADLQMQRFIKKKSFIRGASREKRVFEMNVTEQVEGVEAWVGGN